MRFRPAFLAALSFRRWIKVVVDYIHDWFLMCLALFDSPHLITFACLGAIVLLIVAGVIIYFEQETV